MSSFLLFFICFCRGEGRTPGMSNYWTAVMPTLARTHNPKWMYIIKTILNTTCCRNSVSSFRTKWPRTEGICSWYKGLVLLLLLLMLWYKGQVVVLLLLVILLVWPSAKKNHQQQTMTHIHVRLHCCIAAVKQSYNHLCNCTEAWAPSQLVPMHCFHQIPLSPENLKWLWIVCNKLSNQNF